MKVFSHVVVHSSDMLNGEGRGEVNYFHVQLHVRVFALMGIMIKMVHSTRIL